MAVQRRFVAVRLTAAFRAAKVGKSGLTVTVDVYELGDDGSVGSIVTGASATEVGSSGVYTYLLAGASVDVNGQYIGVFKTSDGTVDQQHEYSAVSTPNWIEEIKAKTDTLGVGDVEVQTPFSPNVMRMTLIRGDDYLAGRLPPITSSAWPDLTGATILFTIRRRITTADQSPADDDLLHMQDTTASRVAGIGAQSVLFEPRNTGGGAHSQVGGTKDLPVGTNSCKWDVQATLADGSFRTLAYGLMTVIEDQTRS